MPGRKHRVIIDTNVWISFLLKKQFQKLDKILSESRITLILSIELLEEIIDVTQRNKFKKYFDLDDVEQLLVKIRNRAILVNVTTQIVFCRDPEDDFLLSLAVDGKATHIITGDKDLLELKKFQKTRIVSVTEYLEHI